MGKKTRTPLFIWRQAVDLDSPKQCISIPSDWRTNSLSTKKKCGIFLGAAEKEACQDECDGPRKKAGMKHEKDAT